MPRTSDSGPVQTTEALCDECGMIYTIGEWFRCPHGCVSRFGEDPFDSYVDIQILDRKDPRIDAKNELGIPGVLITSRSQRRQLMKEKALQYGTQKFEDRGKRKYFI